MPEEILTEMSGEVPLNATESRANWPGQCLEGLQQGRRS